MYTCIIEIVVAHILSSTIINIIINVLLLYYYYPVYTVSMISICIDSTIVYILL